MATATQPQASSPNLDTLNFLSEDEVRRLRDEFGTPVFVYDEATMERNAQQMLAFPNAFGLTVYYSVKANSSAAVLNFFRKMGLSFDASSYWEARKAINVGVEPAKILLTSQEWTEGTEELVEKGVAFNAGSPGQLENYGKAFPGGEISLRLNPGIGSGFINRLTSGGANSSFGIWHEQIPQLKKTLNKYNLRVKRIHHHIGSGHDPMMWSKISLQTLNLAKGFKSVSIINFGGGYPVKSLNTDPEYSYGDIGETLRQNFLIYAQETGTKPHLEIEPGTRLMALSGTLITSVTDVISTAAHDFIKLNGGLTEVTRPGFYGAEHPLVSVSGDGSSRQGTRPYVVTGHTCIAGDVLTTAKKNPEMLAPRELPVTRRDDLIVIERAGAYCASMCMKNFNSFPEVPEVFRRKDGSSVLIRKKQTFEQMIQNEIVVE